MCAGFLTGSAATLMRPGCWARCHTGTTSIGPSRGIGAFPPGADNGHSTTISLLYAYALQRAAELEEAVGTRGAGAGYRARAEALLAAVRARAWDSARGLFRDAPDTSAYSQQTDVLAVLVDAVPIARHNEG